MQRIRLVDNPYIKGETVEFYNKNGIWIKGRIMTFKVTNYIFKAVIECEEKNCNLHYICVCSLYLRKCYNRRFNKK